MTRKIIQFVFVTVVTLCLGSTVTAQDSSMSIKVPFDFYVGERLLPAGEYTIARVVASSNTIRIISTSKHAATIFTVPVSVYRPVLQEKMVFNRYGNDHFLAQIWWPGTATGFEMVKGKFEIQVAKNMRPNLRTIGNQN